MKKIAFIKTNYDSAIFLLELAKHLLERNNIIKFFFINYLMNEKERELYRGLSQKENIEFFLNADDRILGEAITHWADQVLCYGVMYLILTLAFVCI